MSVFFAVLPIAAVIILLVLRQSPLRASAVGVGLATLIATSMFSFSGEDIVQSAMQWWPLVAEVLLIVAGGIALAEVVRGTGAQEHLSAWLCASLGTGIVPVLALVHGVTPFAESVTGFGVGAVIAVPLLCALGLDGRRAATIGLLGLCAVPWGAMGPGTLIAAELGGVGFDELGVASATASLPVFIGAGLSAVLIVAKRGERLAASLASVASAAMLWLGILGANILVGTAPAGALGALATLTVHLLVSRLRGTRVSWPASLRRALVPYGVLLAGVILASMLVQATGAERTPLRFLASPAAWLMVATSVAAGAKPGSFQAVRARALRIWLRVGPATGLFIVLGMVMSVSGMSAEIALWVAGLGAGYSFLAPSIGAVGGFITGSNSGANAMFAASQAHAATTIGLNALSVLAVQNVTASLLTMASPTRIELAVRLCPEPPPRGPVFGSLLSVNAVIVAVLGIGLFASWGLWG